MSVIALPGRSRILPGTPESASPLFRRNARRSLGCVVFLRPFPFPNTGNLRRSIIQVSTSDEPGPGRPRPTGNERA